MELRNIVKNLSKYKIFLAVSVIIGMLLGMFYYSLPKTYTATGSFYVKRSVDTLRLSYFSYEGYYGQQTAQAYTNTAIALFESLDTRFESLSRVGLSTNIVNLKKFSKVIKVTKAGPQLITLTVTSKDPRMAEALWESVANTTIEKSRFINIGGDPFLSISKTSEVPVVRDVYKPLWLCLTTGGLLAPLIVILFISLRSYFKWK
jgi:capsular polysaccharide biosynthesis protein